MLGLSKRLQRGDTLIEVLFAVTVFSLVAVGALTIMNSSMETAQRSLEISLVREQMDAQAESIRYIHDAYVAAYPNPVAGQPSGEWAKIIANAVPAAASFGGCIVPTKAFVINTDTVKVEAQSVITSTVQTYARLRLTIPVSSEGLWVEAVQTNPQYVDFHISACWSSQGLSVPMTLGTIVRLYVP